MGDLVVPLDLLAETVGSLDLLIAEFHDAGRIVDQSADEVGAPVVRDALDEFASSWKAHRENLIAKMIAVRDMAAQSRQAFIAADNELAGAIRDAVDAEH